MVIFFIVNLLCLLFQSYYKNKKFFRWLQSFFIHLGVLPIPLILKIRIFGFLTAIQEVAGPWSFGEMPLVQPNISLSMDCLYFSHYLIRPNFVMWQRMEFGVEKSSTRWLSIHPCESGDTLILANDLEDQESLYDWKVTIIEKTSYL